MAASRSLLFGCLLALAGCTAGSGAGLDNPFADGRDAASLDSESTPDAAGDDATDPGSPSDSSGADAPADVLDVARPHDVPRTDVPTAPLGPFATGSIRKAGAGFTDVSPRQLVRSDAGILYAIVPTCSHYPECAGAVLQAWRSSAVDVSQGFLPVDAPHAPQDGAGSSAAALDAAGLIHVLWNTHDGMARTATIDTATDRWSGVTDLEPTDWTGFGQGDEGVALAVDASGRSHAFWNRQVDGHLRIRYATLDQGAWSPPATLDDVPLGDRRNAWHPTAAFASDGTLWLGWLEGSGNYVADGIVRVMARSPSGGWGASEAIPGAAMTSIDNGPSMLVTQDGTVHLLFDDTGNVATYWYNDGTGWWGDLPPPLVRTHDPSLGPDGRGGIFVYGHGQVPADDLSGHGNDLFAMHLPAGGAWGAWTRIVTGSFDCSVSARWAQFHDPRPDLLDVAWWGDAYPNELWLGLNPN